MDSPWLIGFLILSSYLLGSIPFGVVVSRLLGAVDPRSAGSKNVGFTNVLRVSGKKAGILTLLGDIGKGWLAGWVGTMLLHQESATDSRPSWPRTSSATPRRRRSNTRSSVICTRRFWDSRVERVWLPH